MGTFSEMSPSATTPTPAKKRRKSDRSGEESPESGNTPTGIKKDRLYCICKTKYDRTKFYVGCDICSNWFHGSCVGITAKMSKKMSEYICDECKSAKESEQLYCLCRQPYDDSQFYIGCEKCEDWFHGRCVGILQAEAENIEEYVCPKCEPNSRLNFANLKELNSQDRELITKTFKSIQSNRYSNPFKEPVDPKGHPKYYEVVKEPMDLKIIERKVNFNEYLNLAEFIGDVTKIFEIVGITTLEVSPSPAWPSPRTTWSSSSSSRSGPSETGCPPPPTSDTMFHRKYLVLKRVTNIIITK